MKEFTFKEQTLIQMWTNETFTIEAETYEEAKKMLLNKYENGSIYEYSNSDFQYMYETADTRNTMLLNEDDDEIEEYIY